MFPSRSPGVRGTVPPETRPISVRRETSSTVRVALIALGCLAAAVVAAAAVSVEAAAVVVGVSLFCALAYLGSQRGWFYRSSFHRPVYGSTLVVHPRPRAPAAVVVHPGPGRAASAHSRHSVPHFRPGRGPSPSVLTPPARSHGRGRPVAPPPGRHAAPSVGSAPRRGPPVSRVPRPIHSSAKTGPVGTRR